MELDEAQQLCFHHTPIQAVEESEEAEHVRQFEQKQGRLTMTREGAVSYNSVRHPPLRQTNASSSDPHLEVRPG